MNEFIQNNLVIIQSIAASTLLYIIILLFYRYFKRKYLFYYSMSWALILLTNISSLLFIGTAHYAFAMICVISMMVSSFYYYKATMHFKGNTLLPKAYFGLLSILLLTFLTLLLNIDTYYKMTLLSVYASLYYFFSALCLYKTKIIEYKIFSVWLFILVVLTLAVSLTAKLDNLNQGIKMLHSIAALGSGIGILWLFSIKQSEIDKVNSYELYRLSYTDSMTGVFNRTYLDNLMSNHFLEKNIFSVIVIDLNNLKEFNDQYGHDVGDLAIKHTANQLITFKKEDDIVIRRGGDEFIMFLTIETKEAFLMVIDNIRSAINEIAVAGDYISIAIGGAYEDQTKDMSDLLKLAEHNMYNDKQNTRSNR